MRILFALPSFEIGGAEAVCRDVAAGLRARGHETGLLVMQENRRRGTPEYPADAFDRVHEIGQSAWRRGGPYFVSVVRGYDLVDLALLAPMWRPGLAAAGRPIVHTVHSIVGWTLWYTHGFYQGEPVAAVVTVDRQTAAYVSDLWPGVRVRHIPNGIDVSRFGMRNAERGTHSPPVVGTIGRISPWAKHHVMFARLAGWVQSRARAAGRPEPVFQIVGGSRPENRYLDDQLKDAAEKEGGELDITGYVPAEAVPGRLAAMDVFCLTSSTEGSPLALLEAMASGLPCVATAVGGVPELLIADSGNGKRGALVAVDDDVAAGEAVEGFLEDPDLAHEIGRRARAYVEREHRLDLMVERRERLYEEVLGGRDK
jgi:glycosyltransferase involved in cell wall biosynthesis